MNILDHTSYVDYLNSELERRLQQNSKYSLRAFSRDLNLSPGELSEVIRSKRTLSSKSAVKISRALGLSEVERKHLLLLAQGMTFDKDASVDNQSKNKSVLDLEYFKVIEGWYHFAILNLSECINFKWNTKSIANKLGISKFEVSAAIDRLTKVNLLKRHKAKMYVLNDYVETPTDVPSSSIRSYHRQILQKALIALDEQSTEDREISGMGLAFDPKYLPEVKNELRNFQDRIATKYSKGKKTEVYQLETLFFRLTKKEVNK